MIITRKKVDPCLHEDGCEDCWSQLKDGVRYRVIGIHDGWYMIQSNFGDWIPSLYPAGLFDILDASVEPGWIVDIDCDSETDDNDDEIYATRIGFPECMVPGFWEQIHDRREYTTRLLIPILERLGIPYSIEE